MKCLNCGAELTPDQKFCTNCGTQNVKKTFCSNCGIEISAEQKFCPQCGTVVNINSNPTNIVIPTPETTTHNVSPLHKFVSEIIRKISNGYDDVSTLTTKANQNRPANLLTEWIQIAGPLFYNQGKDGDIYVEIVIESYTSNPSSVYNKFGFQRTDEQNTADINYHKYYKQSETQNIANEIEELIVALTDQNKLSSFVNYEYILPQANTADPELKKARRKLWVQMIVLIISMIFSFGVLFYSIITRL